MDVCHDLEPLLARVESLDPHFSENGMYQYHSIDDGFKLSIPKGAIVGDHKIQVAIMRYGPIGPFEYPDGYKPVSPIVWLCSSQKKFQKDLEISLPHCISSNNVYEEENLTHLTILKADHKRIRNASGQEMYQFKEADAQSLVINNSYGTLRTSHFCFYCVGVYTRKLTEQANFCLTVARPIATTVKYTISICLTLDLPTCIKVSK